ncbi:hypothetical protein ACMXYX_03585 [Neptuniibacter sp. QD72_48]|uniref:hypothetical protein n=1 Tax=Neptuniibacter sp. QD72_48 TaxID=3398214 RepID=UPI0039F549E6
MTAKYRVIDSVMGSGKTTKIIEELRQANPEEDRFLVITPYLDEVERFTNEVPELDFKKTKNSEKSNLATLHELLEAQENIASTHALFTRWNDKTLELLKSNRYHLIIDETVNCLREYGSQDGELSSNDIMLLVDSGLIRVAEDGGLEWNGERKLRYDSTFTKLKEDCDSRRLFRMGDDDHTDGMMFWEFPIEILNAFQQVTVLTYLFSGSLMAAYFEGNGVEPVKMTIDGQKQLVEWSEELEAEAVKPIARLITLLEDEKLNAVGERTNAFATGWMADRTPAKMEEISKAARNVLQNKYKAKADTAMWSCVLRFKESLTPKGFKGAFIECNKRATNEFRDRKHLVYLRNIYMTPALYNFCRKMRGVNPSHDDYALAELLQWVFRSAIRDGKPIELYLPSSRMRMLLKDWMA